MEEVPRVVVVIPDTKVPLVLTAPCVKSCEDGRHGQDTCNYLDSDTTGQVGLGTRRFAKDEAEALATRLNEEHEGFLHRAIDMASEDPAVVLAAMRSADAAEKSEIVNYPDLVAAEAAAMVSTESLDGKLIWLKPRSEVWRTDVPAA